MEKLAEILRAAGIDASTLEMIFQADMEAIHRMTVPGAAAIPTWEKLRGLVSQTGYWPVLLGDNSDLAPMKEHMERLRYPRAVRILEEAAAIDPVEWFENRRLDEIDALQRDLEEDPDMRDHCTALLSGEGPFRGMPQGPWPEDDDPNHTLLIPLDAMTKQPLPRVDIGLVSTAFGWQAPAYLRYGAWNNCPSPAEHVALFHYWGERYEAELVGVAGPVVEMKVVRPPTSRDAALELAAQQYLYCEDIVDQGTDTLQRRATVLLGGTVWYFWWD